MPNRYTRFWAKRFAHIRDAAIPARSSRRFFSGKSDAGFILAPDKDLAVSAEPLVKLSSVTPDLGVKEDTPYSPDRPPPREASEGDLTLSGQIVSVRTSRLAADGC